MNEILLRELLQSDEDYDLELKAAANSFSRTKLNDYCAALANENGGHLVLGVNGSKRIIGSNAFLGNWNKLAHELTVALRIRIKVHNLETSDGRVLVFDIPRRPVGVPIQVVGGTGKYRYPIRNGESLDEMDATTLQAIFDERQEDWSSTFIDGAKYSDLDQTALTKFRSQWAAHTRSPERKSAEFKSMLSDLQLIEGKKVTAAALLLFGKEDALSRLIPDAEIIFEWRNNESDIAYGERKNWRAGFITTQDDVWNSINARNTVFRYQEGFVQRDIPAFDEESVREAVINAFAHRDYQITGRSIVIKASPERLFIENPGRLMPGVTLENIFDKSEWRNRKLAESLEKVHIMERSSQGIDKIFRHTIESGKGLPILRTSHDPSVSLEIPTTLKDQNFIDYLEKVTNRQQASLSVKEIIELEQIRQGKKTSSLNHKDKFLELGVIERIGHGRGSKYILANQYYKHANATGQHTRLAGLPREVKRNIILEHLKKNKHITNHELQEAMPDMAMRDIYRLLKSMKEDGLIEHQGSKRYGHWRGINRS